MWELNERTPALLVEYGFRFDSSLMDDDRPYLLDTGNGRLAELPVHWMLDDWEQYAYLPEPSIGVNIESPGEDARPVALGARRAGRRGRAVRPHVAPVPVRTGLADPGARPAARARRRASAGSGSHRSARSPSTSTPRRRPSRPARCRWCASTTTSMAGEAGAALVTGAAGGIGVAVADALEARGYAVARSDLRGEHAVDVADSARRRGADRPRRGRPRSGRRCWSTAPASPRRSRSTRSATTTGSGCCTCTSAAPTTPAGCSARGCASGAAGRSSTSPPSSP